MGGGSVPLGQSPAAGFGGATSANSDAGGASGAISGGSGKGPIKVAFFVTDYRTFRQSNGAAGGPDPQQPFRDLVGYLNAHGGLAGRTIRPDYFSANAGDTNTTTDQEAQSACAHFTQDQHDELVVSQEWWNPALESCLSAARVPHFDAGISFNADGTEQRKTPAYIDAATIGADRYEPVQLKVALAQKWIKPGEKIGVFVMGCPMYTRIYDNVVVPTAKSYGLQLDQEQIQCNNGTADLAPTVSQIQSAVLKFQSDGVGAVMAVSPAESVIWAFFSQQAEQQHYNPTYLMTSNAYPEELAEARSSSLAFPADQLPLVHGIGWSSIADFGTQAPAANAAQRAQRELCKKISPDWGGAKNQTDGGASNTLSEYFAACDTVLVLDKLLAADGGSTALSALNSVYPSVMSSFPSATAGSGRFRPPTGRHDGISSVTPFQYDGHCQCIKSAGPPVSVP